MTKLLKWVIVLLYIGNGYAQGIEATEMYLGDPVKELNSIHGVIYLGDDNYKDGKLLFEDGLTLNFYPLFGAQISRTYYLERNLVNHLLLAVIQFSDIDECLVRHFLVDLSDKSTVSIYKLDTACFDSEVAIPELHYENSKFIVDFPSSISDGLGIRQPAVKFIYSNNTLYAEIRKNQKQKTPAVVQLQKCCTNVIQKK